MLAGGAVLAWGAVLADGAVLACGAVLTDGAVLAGGAVLAWGAALSPSMGAVMIGSDDSCTCPDSCTWFTSSFDHVSMGLLLLLFNSMGFVHKTSEIAPPLHWHPCQ